MTISLFKLYLTSFHDPRWISDAGWTVITRTIKLVEVGDQKLMNECTWRNYGIINRHGDFSTLARVTSYWFDSVFAVVFPFCCWGCGCGCCWNWWGMLSWEDCFWCSWNIWWLAESCWAAMPLEGSESPPSSWVAIFNRRTSAVNASFRAVQVQQNKISYWSRKFHTMQL